MKLYLQRHCQAEAGEPMDSTRPLTAQGWEDAITMGGLMDREINSPLIVLSSPFLRATDTARIVSIASDADMVTSPLLDPDGDAKRAIRYIRAMAGSWEKSNVLVVTHHPLCNNILELLTGARVDEVNWEHGAIAHIHHQPELGKSRLSWMVPPHVLAETQQHCQAPGTDDLKEIVKTLPTSVLEEARGLLHPKHFLLISELRTKMKTLFAGFFRYQGAAILKRVKLETAHVKAKEAEGDPTPDQILPDSLHPLSFQLNSSQGLVYNQLIADAIAGAAKQLAEEEDWQSSLPPDAIETFLRDNSLAKLTGGLNDTTTQRLRDAIAGVYANGGGFQEIVDAVSDTVEEFSTVRAGMIAQTEVNAAYNYGRNSIAMAAGAQEKSWDPDGIACPICMLNVAQGYIPIETDFTSGDDLPPAHPNCDCSIDFRISSEE